MSSITRRSFLKTGLAAGAVATAGSIPLLASERSATDTVVLGRSKVQVTRLAFGTEIFTAEGEPIARIEDLFTAATRVVDRALLLGGFAGALRRSELVALEMRMWLSNPRAWFS